MRAMPKDAARISVIVPSWNDAENLAVLLPKLRTAEYCLETIVVDASADPSAQKIADEHGASFLTCAVPSRGAQLNAGAHAARGDVLLFQHADTDISDTHLRAILGAMRDPAVIGGAFYRKFDDRHPRLMWLESVARFLTRNGGTLFGDQSVFVRRDVFVRLGGFAEIPLMEDVEFSRRLRPAGKIVVLDPPVQTSSRRHLREGAWRKTIQNALIILLYKLGVSPQRLHRWYYKGRQSGREQRTTSEALSA
jgi:rSAM/selenodomain-associated transferase 2